MTFICNIRVERKSQTRAEIIHSVILSATHLILFQDGRDLKPIPECTGQTAVHRESHKHKDHYWHPVRTEETRYDV